MAANSIMAAAEIFLHGRKRGHPSDSLDSTPTNSQTSSQQKKRNTPKFVPPLKKAINIANEWSSPAGTEPAPDIPSPRDPGYNGAGTSPGNRHIATASAGSTKQMQQNIDEGNEKDLSLPTASSPSRLQLRRYRKQTQPRRYTYTLTTARKETREKHSGRHNLKETAHFHETCNHKKTMPTGHTVQLGVFDFPVSQNNMEKSDTVSIDDTVNDDIEHDYTTRSIRSRLNASISGKTLEQQVQHKYCTTNTIL